MVIRAWPRPELVGRQNDAETAIANELLDSMIPTAFFLTPDPIGELSGGQITGRKCRRDLERKSMGLFGPSRPG